MILVAFSSLSRYCWIHRSQSESDVFLTKLVPYYLIPQNKELAGLGADVTVGEDGAVLELIDLEKVIIP